MQLVNGTALIARLAKSADDLGVRLLVNTPATRLRTEDGAVTGAVLAAPDGEVTVHARRGVLLAAGGFPNDVARRRELFPRTPTGRGALDARAGGDDRRRRHRWASRQAACSTRRWRLLPRGVRCRWCPTAADGSAPTRTSSTAESPA